MANNQFIGKGKENEDGRIMLSVKLSEVLEFATEYRGEKYLHCNVVRMKAPDKYGRTHTVYTFRKEEEVKE